MISFLLNRTRTRSDCRRGLAVLDFIRGGMNLTGTKEGCREGDCGACMVLLGRPGKNGVTYSAVNSCILPVGEIDGCHLVTIEGLNRTDGLTPIQQAFYDHAASQCGFCTPGMIVSMTGFFLNSCKPDPDAGIEALDGNICRCTGYEAVKRAIRDLCNSFQAEKLSRSATPAERISLLVEQRLLPEYFMGVPEILDAIETDTTDSPEVSLIGKTLVAGGTDLYVQKPEQLRHEDPVFLSQLPGLNFARIEENFCRIGAATTISQVRESEIIRKMFPSLHKALGLVSCSPVRNRATVGGNIVNASPIGDMSIIFLALGASVVLNNSGKRRTVPLEDFYLGYKDLDMIGNEILELLLFPVPARGSCFSVEKVSKRRHLDTASVNSAILFRKQDGIIKSIRISAGGVAPVPLLLRKTCSYLTGRSVTKATIEEAAGIAGKEISPISDVRGSAEYKTVLLKRLLRAHFTEAGLQ